MATYSVLYTDPKGNLLVRGNAKVRTKVTDEKGEHIGRVLDLIGNVKDPYMLISSKKSGLKKVVLEG